MESIISDLGQFISDHRAWAGPIVGIIAFGESLAIIGMFIPATPIMIAIGGLVGAGIIEPLPVIIGAIIGAVIGDIISYFLGWWLGRNIIHKWPLNKHRSGVARARLLFRRYGFSAVFLGRFFGPVRCTVPMVAGMMSMDQTRFQTANVLSALVWAPLMFLPGWLAGRGAGIFAKMDGDHMFWFAIGITVLTLIVTVIGVRFFKARPRRERKSRRVQVSPAE
ncbi:MULTISPECIES: DedA family protein [Brucella/Ochrobactrum group]|uniref:DedA family protein n=2 Tax=Ochrobactrum TaxID=528 RepID=A0A2P9HNX0_9HYPH|nr:MULTISPECIES: DedA family protein [Brucella]MCI1001618.1 DedA family protein [Ochrobactrum sp. C6C9]RRD22095.1 DedA family protein [Brucellaceae bacterium VT-16-1752]WHT42263.1 DedA family protein [Ochrobactrum sp. SSR]MDX4072438.1 DedA family protein [Brucella sp. NBRC 113783]NNU61341.1 DedA family protein [[Ochrobactrum] soli]